MTSEIAWFDSHIHLHAIPPDAREACIGAGACAFATAPDDWDAVLQLKYPRVVRGLGLHPWRVHLFEDNWQSVMDRLEQHLRDDPTLIVGEIGLDFDPRTPADPALQREVFQAQLELALTYDRPCSIHIRKAFDVLYQHLKPFTSLRGSLHGFGGGLGEARRFVKLGWKIGANGIVCRDNARRYHDLIRGLGLDHLLLETDGPYVALPGADQFHCGDIAQIGARVSQLLDLPLESVAQETTRAAQDLFLLRAS
ncbi:TatD DNase family protein [Sulfurivirga caldicuralii]|uniref:TatD DNase family protein n=1 Tax=Sulfurivirga caldicuralii TaxID=364032 RepID=A0A1N6DMH9_9GAMM|nr:TatD family hydrolase [Sulfurivirga caldicuralii]SIN71874.1 TatD DNase family protein [Sulfurivirga caldicuralii]